MEKRVVNPAALKWDELYRNEGEKWQQNRPHPLLAEWLPRLPRTGLALDAAAGVGVNGLALARRGLRVVAVDISEVGLRLARQLFAREGWEVATAVYDLSSPWFPHDAFDVILNFRFLERATFPVYRRALKPGGWLLFATFVKNDPQASYPDHYLNPGELRAAFADFHIHVSKQREMGRGEMPPKISDLLVAQKPLKLQL